MGRSATRWPTWGDPSDGTACGGWSLAGLREGVRNHRTDADRADFDALYAARYQPLLRQAFLLTGDLGRAVACVRRAFAAAWAEWPEAVADAEPEQRVRTLVHAGALAPWRGLAPFAGRRRRADDAEERQRLGDAGHALLTALRRLPRRRRGALVLHALEGLDAAAVAVETECSTPVAEGRIAGARTAVLEALVAAGVDPGAAGEGLDGLLRETARLGCGAGAQVPAEEVRRQSARRTAAATGAAGLLVAVAVASIVTTALGFGPAQLLGNRPATRTAPVCGGGAGPACGPGADADAPRAPHQEP